MPPNYTTLNIFCDTAFTSFFFSISACAFLNSSIRFSSSSASKTDMRVHIHSNTNIRMPHKVLQGLWIHSRFCHIGAISMAAYMWSDVRPLHSVNVDRLQ